MQNRTVAELKTLAKSLGLKGYSRMRKAQLVAAIERAEVRPVAAKGQTVAQLKQICRDRKLTGWSRLSKAQLLSLVESTNQLAAREPSADEQIHAAISDVTTVADAKVLHRIMRANNSGQPAASADVMHWRRIEAKAVKNLREAAATESQRKFWANRYVGVTSGIYCGA